MKGDYVYLQHILDAIARIDSYGSVGRDVFVSTSHWQDAVVRQLEVIGEATKRVSQALRAQYPDIPGRRIAGLRDVLTHDYMGVDIVAVWAITQRDLPDLKPRIEAALRTAGGTTDGH